MIIGFLVQHLKLFGIVYITFRAGTSAFRESIGRHQLKLPHLAKGSPDSYWGFRLSRKVRPTLVGAFAFCGNPNQL